MAAKKSNANAPDNKSKPATNRIPKELSPPEAYARYLPIASLIPRQSILPCRADTRVAYANVRIGVKAIAPHATRLAEEAPKIDLAEVLDLDNLAIALLFASGRVDDGPISKGEIAANLSRARALREPMLLIAEGLALLGLVPIERVATIRAGNGAYDSAMDAIALEALYRENAVALESRHPFTEAMLSEANEAGTWLIRHLTPNGARIAPVSTNTEATTIRDQLWTLLVTRFASLRKLGFFVFGEAVNTHVPLLQSREVSPRAASAPLENEPSETTRDDD